MRYAAALMGLFLMTFAVASADAAEPLSKRFAEPTGEAAPSFRRHVVPLMSHLGCSGRACHGSFQGRGGFQLSLFGYDFKKDHAALIGKTTSEDSDAKEFPTRINAKDPDESLILLKPTLGEKHGGKQVISEDAWEYNLIRRWIAAGAKMDVEATGTFDRLTVEPSEIVFDRPGQKVQLRVIAHWADGTVEDVTEISRFRTNDESIAQISEEGLVESKTKGDTHVVAFYDNGVAPVPVMLPVSKLVGSKHPKVDTRTKVDELVVQKLRKVGIVPSGVADDATFLRRVRLDLTGSLPTAAEARAFLDDKSKDKRARKIDELLKTPEYAAWWTTKFNDWTGASATQVSDRNFRTEQARQWYDWVNKRIAQNKPYDEIVAGIVLATSRTSPDQDYEAYATEMSSYVKAEGAADFAERPNMPHYWARRNMRQPEERALSFSYAFLGVRLQCAQCHKHPFDQWTQQDFKQFQAFFEPIYFGTPRADRDAYNKMQNELNKSVGYDPKNRNAKNAAQKRREMYEETKRRALAGEPIPWQELQVQPLKKLTAKEREQLIKRKGKKYAGRVITPRVLGGDEMVSAQYDDPRAPLMDWLRHENPYFAKAFVNRVWANHFGRGIVEPADDLNLANPPSNAALFDYLADGFVASGYDMRWLHREILNSDTYQRDWRTNDTNELDESNFSRAMVRRIHGEVVADAIRIATFADDKAAEFVSNIEYRTIGPSAGYGRYGRNAPGAYAANLFGKPVRETTCDCERTTDPTLLQTIFMRNDQEVLASIDGKDGWVASLRPQRKGSVKDDPRYKKRAAELKERLKKAPKKDQARLKASYKRQLDYYARELAKPSGGIRDDVNVDRLIEDVFLRTVARYPSADERKLAKQTIDESESQLDGVRDLLWAMLNTKEFIVNH